MSRDLMIASLPLKSIHPSIFSMLAILHRNLGYPSLTMPADETYSRSWRVPVIRRVVEDAVAILSSFLTYQTLYETTY